MELSCPECKKQLGEGGYYDMFHVIWFCPECRIRITKEIDDE